MSNVLTILNAKGHISTQDLGRFTAQHIGFSASGAADEYAFLSANKWLNNKATTPLLEITFGQVTFSVCRLPNHTHRCKLPTISQ